MRTGQRLIEAVRLAGLSMPGIYIMGRLFIRLLYILPVRQFFLCFLMIPHLYFRLVFLFYFLLFDILVFGVCREVLRGHVFPFSPTTPSTLRVSFLSVLTVSDILLLDCLSVCLLELLGLPRAHRIGVVHHLGITHVMHVIALRHQALRCLCWGGERIPAPSLAAGVGLRFVSGQHMYLARLRYLTFNKLRMHA